MQKLNIFPALVLIIGLMAAGCVSTSSPAALTETPTPQIIYVTVLVTPAETASAVPSTAPVTAATTLSHDMLFHRWVNTTSGSESGSGEGSELRFYPDGSLIMKNGSVSEVSSNIVIKNVTEMRVGTWTSVGGDMYLGKLALSGASTTTPEAIEMKYYPAGSDPRYPGLVIDEKVIIGETVYFRAKTD